MSISITPATHIGIGGRTRSGKTVHTKNVIIPALLKQPNNVLVVLDPKKEYTEFKTTVKTPAELNQLLYGDGKPKARVIRALVDETTEEIAEEYLRAAWTPFSSTKQKKKARPFSVRFFIEDMPVFYHSAYRTPYWLMKWAALGAAYGRSLAFTTQRFQLIPKTPLTQIDYLWVFRLSEYDNKRVIKEYYGDRSYNVIATLPKYGYAVLGDSLDEPVIFKPYSGKVPPTPSGIIYDA